MPEKVITNLQSSYKHIWRYEELQRFLNVLVRPSVEIKSAFNFKITFCALQNVNFLQHVVNRK